MNTLSLLQLNMLIIGLKFEAKTGMKMTRHVDSPKLAKEFLGIPTRKKVDKNILVSYLEMVKKAVDAKRSEQGQENFESFTVTANEDATIFSIEVTK